MGPPCRCHVHPRGRAATTYTVRTYVPYRVQEGITRARAGGEEGPPPPAVVLVAQLEVAQQDGDLGARRHLRRGSGVGESAR